MTRAAVVLVALTAAIACGGPASTVNVSSAVDVDGAKVSIDATIQKLFPQAVRSKGTFSVAVSAPSPPFVMFADANNQTLGGVDVDLAKGVAALAGLKADYHQYQFAGLVPALQASQVDVLWSGVLPSPDRRQVADFVVYFRNPYGIIVAKGNPKNIHGVSDLCGLTVALLQGSSPPIAIVADRTKRCTSAGKPAIKTITYPDRESTDLAVQTGRADAEVGAGASMAYTATTANGGKSFDYVTDTEGLGGTVYFPDGVGVLKGQDDLLKAVQAAVQKLIDDGVYQKVLAKYGQGQFGVQKATINTF